MNDRYTKLFELNRNLYLKDCPVLIEAGALLKDNLSDKVLVQLKFRNLAKDVIKAIKIRLVLLDVKNDPIRDIIEYDYLDLNMLNDCSTGDKIPIYLKNSSVRGFIPYVVEVVFTSNSVYKYKDGEFSSIWDLKELSEVIGKEELSQYRKNFGLNMVYIPKTFDNFYICSCGKINDNNICYSCHNDINELINVDYDILKKDYYYFNAVDKMKGSLSNVIDSRNIFIKLNDYRDSKNMVYKCDDLIVNLGKRNKTLRIVFSSIILVLIMIFSFNYLYKNVIIPSNNIKEVRQLLKNQKSQEAYKLANKLLTGKNKEKLLSEIQEYGRYVLVSSNNRYGVSNNYQYDNKGNPILIENKYDRVELLYTYKENYVSEINYTINDKKSNEVVHGKYTFYDNMFNWKHRIYDRDDIPSINDYASFYDLYFEGVKSFHVNKTDVKFYEDGTIKSYDWKYDNNKNIIMWNSFDSKYNDGLNAKYDNHNLLVYYKNGFDDEIYIKREYDNFGNLVKKYITWNDDERLSRPDYKYEYKYDGDYNCISYTYKTRSGYSGIIDSDDYYIKEKISYDFMWLDLK